MSFKQKALYLVSGCLGLLVLESIIKYYFILNKIPEQGFYLFSGYLQIGYYINKGISFNIPLPNLVAIIFTIFILIFLSFFWWRTLAIKNFLQLITISLIIVGALSNLLDRLLFGYVIDYINVLFWPVFNLADTMIVVGVAIYIITEFSNKKNVSRSKKNISRLQ
jgi:signal peptidase II